MATASAAPGPSGMQQVDLTKLSLHQLAQLKQQLDQDINLFQESLQALKMAQAKFLESGESIDRIASTLEGSSMLVPLTGSMYVPGSLADTKNVIIDIGTGYFVQKDMDSAKDYFKRRTEFVTEQMEKIQALGIEKTKLREAILMVIDMKMQPPTGSAKPSTS